MSQQAKAGRVTQVRCTCGNEAGIDAGSVGRPLACGACRSIYVVVWGIDPRSKKAVPMAFAHAAAETHGFKMPAGMMELACPCGQRLFARPRETGKRVQCPLCDTWMKLQHSKDPQTLETRIRVVESRLNKLPPVPPSAEPKVESNALDVLCSCGASLRIDLAPTGKEVQCPDCGSRIRLEQRMGSQSFSIVVDPPGGDSADKRGLDEQLILDDFA